MSCLLEAVLTKPTSDRVVAELLSVMVVLKLLLVVQLTIDGESKQ